MSSLAYESVHAAITWASWNIHSYDLVTFAWWGQHMCQHLQKMYEPADTAIIKSVCTTRICSHCTSNWYSLLMKHTQQVMLSMLPEYASSNCHRSGELLTVGICMRTRCLGSSIDSYQQFDTPLLEAVGIFGIIDLAEMVLNLAWLQQIY